MLGIGIAAIGAAVLWCGVFWALYLLKQGR